jgi:hypothetical protein
VPDARFSRHATRDAAYDVRASVSTPRRKVLFLVVTLLVRRTSAHSATFFLRQLLGVGRRRQRALVRTHSTTTGTLLVLMLMTVFVMLDLATMLTLMMAVVAFLMMLAVVMTMAHGFDLATTPALTSVVFAFFAFAMVDTPTTLALVSFLHHVGIASRVRNNLTTSSALLVAFVSCS